MTTMVRAPSAQVNAAELKLTRATATGKVVSRAVRATKNAEPADPRTQSGVYLDDRRRMADRVAMLRTGHLHAQMPASRTRRMLSNIECWSGDAGAIVARANLTLWEHRKAVTKAWPAFQIYEIVGDPAGGALIATKIICLLERDAPLGNYAFIL